MKKKHIIILSIVGLSIILTGIGIVAITIFDAFVYGHKPVFNNSQKYMWLMNDSFKGKIDPFFTIGHERESDSFYEYINYKKDLIIIVWEFYELKSIDIKKVPITTNNNFDNYEFNPCQIHNENVHLHPTLTVNYKLNFNNSLSVNLNENSVIKKTIESTNYRGFFGNINKMSFSNSEGKNLILFDYKGISQPTLFILYKKNNSFYVILINSHRPIDERVIKLLNLE